MAIAMGKAPSAPSGRGPAASLGSAAGVVMRSSAPGLRSPVAATPAPPCPAMASSPVSPLLASAASTRRPGRSPVPRATAGNQHAAAQQQPQPQLQPFARAAAPAAPTQRPGAAPGCGTVQSYEENVIVQPGSQHPLLQEIHRIQAMLEALRSTQGDEQKVRGQERGQRARHLGCVGVLRLGCCTDGTHAAAAACTQTGYCRVSSPRLA